MVNINDFVYVIVTADLTNIFFRQDSLRDSILGKEKLIFLNIYEELILLILCKNESDMWLRLVNPSEILCQTFKAISYG